MTPTTGTGSKPDTNKPPKRFKKIRGKTTRQERALVAEVVANGEGGVTPSQVKGLALTLNRSEDAVKKMIQVARAKFLNAADYYVGAHKEAVTRGLELATSDPKYLEVAQKGSQWAIEHMSHAGDSLIEKKSEESSGVKVLIGVKIGGLTQDVKSDGQ